MQTLNFPVLQVTKKIFKKNNYNPKYNSKAFQLL
jgi:hypothetical protein